MFLLNEWNWTFSSPDQFSSSTTGPSLVASAPGCLSRRSKGMIRMTSDTIFFAQWLMRPRTTLWRHGKIVGDDADGRFLYVHYVLPHCCAFGKEAGRSSRLVLSIGVSGDSRRHSSAQPFAPRLTPSFLAITKTERPTTRGLAFLTPSGISSFGSLLRM